MFQTLHSEADAVPVLQLLSNIIILISNKVPSSERIVRSWMICGKQ